ncbi:MAG: nicotinate-nucleotide adenylyltransferase [Bacteroidales bacterium]|nr:nicotinate-nucleotide adenylyltransferase [Bacteroidales bacterium]
MTVGIFGGSFNPVHNGHLMVAKTIVERNIAGEVWLTVSPLNPIKKDPECLLPDRERMEMARLAVEDISGLKASDIELTLPRPSYTITTLRTLSELYPNYTFRLIIGSDNMLIFDRWKDHDEIMRLYTPIVYPRPGYECDIALKDFPEMEISSTEIRERLKNNQPVDTLLPQNVYHYIKQYHLYGVTDTE